MLSHAIQQNIHQGTTLMKTKIVNFLLICFVLVVPASAFADALSEAEARLSEGDYRQAMALFTPLAESGDPDAMLGIGRLYENGWGVGKDQAAADNWYTKARQTWEQRMQNGDPRAYLSVGVMYSKGIGVEKSRSKARRLYRQATDLAMPQARAGDLESMYLVGLLMSSKGEYQKRLTEGMEWLAKAAQAGHVKAAKILIHIYQCNCRGVARDDEKAEYWRGILNANETQASS
jgi:TPR repeat protein